MKDMLEKIKNIEKSYIELGEKLSDPNVTQDYMEFRRLSKTRKSMEESVDIYHRWQDAEASRNEASQLIKGETDPDMRAFLQNELDTAEAKISEYEERM